MEDSQRGARQSKKQTNRSGAKKRERDRNREEKFAERQRADKVEIEKRRINRCTPLV